MARTSGAFAFCTPYKQPSSNLIVIAKLDTCSCRRIPVFGSQLRSGASTYPRTRAKKKARPKTCVPFVKTSPRKSYSLRRKARVLAFMDTPSIRSGPHTHRCPTLEEVHNHTKIPYYTLGPVNREKIFSRAAGMRRVTFGKEKWPDMEERLTAAIIERRQERKSVRLRWIQKKARAIFRECYNDFEEDEFCFSTGWFLDFLSQNHISIRAPTNKAQRIPEQYQTVSINFLRFLRRNCHPSHRWVPTRYRQDLEDYGIDSYVGCVRTCRIANMDQTPLPYEFLDDHTYDLKGSKTVQIKSSRSGWDKRQAILMLTSFGDGKPRVKPVIIFKRTPDNKLERLRNKREVWLLQLEESLYNPEVVVWFNKEGYCNEELLLRYI
ncbi:hypothetical protein K440DRAFT_644053 [Wilcoxina mikolae CBS 423.85]|nr:hypothetical protein K440DRAFT_644053 [Wilcoxina mikolae CBS 423.85]